MKSSIQSLRRRHVLLASIAACTGAPLHAQTSHPIVKLMVGSPPGALGDVVTRLMARELEIVAGTATIVDNKPGASGLIAANAVAKSAGDGATLLIAPDNVMVVNPFIYPKIPYNVERDFAPIGVLGKATLVLVANPATGIRSMQDLIRLAREKPEQLTYSSGGVGHVTHLGVELISDRLNIKLRHVPYKGTSPALTAVIGGEVPLMYLGVSGAMPQIRAGKLIPLAASGPTAKETFPDVPALQEFHKDLDISVWFGLFAPSSTPAPLITELNRHVNAILQKPEVAKRFAEYGMTTQPGSPAALTELVKSDTVRFESLIKSLNITAE